MSRSIKLLCAWFPARQIRHGGLVPSLWRANWPIRQWWIPCALLQVPILSGFPVSALAETITWTGGAGNGSWHTEGNWDLARVPGIGDDVVIPDLPGTTSVTITSGSGAINTLSCDELLILSGGTLDTSGAATMTGGMTWTSGTLTGAGTLTIPAGATLTLNGGILQKVLDNFGTVNWSASNSVNGYGGTFTNKSGGVINASVSGHNWRGYQGTNAFINEGIFNKTGGGNLSFDQVFGSLAVTNAAGGQMNLIGGSLTFADAGTWTNLGVIDTAALTTLVFNHTMTHDPASQLTGTGALQFNAGTHTFGPGMLETDRPITVTIYATVNFNTDLDFPQPFTLSGDTVGGSGHLTMTGGMTWSGGTLTGAGTLTIPAGATLTLNGGNLQKVLDNFGTVNWSSGMVIGQGGSFTNKSGGVFNASVSGPGWRSGQGTNTFTNEGVLNKTGGGNLTFDQTGGSLAVTNAAGGQMNLIGGSLTFANPGTWTNLGVIDTAALTTLVFNHTMTHDPASQLTGTGALQFNAGTHTFGPGMLETDRPITVTIYATVNFNTDLDFPQPFTLSGDTVGGSGHLTMTGGMTWSGGTLTGAGTLTIPAGATLTLNGGNLQKVLDNFGTVNWSSNYVIGYGGTFTNKSGGVFNASVSGPGWRSGQGTNTFTNEGVLNKTGGGNLTFDQTGGSLAVTNAAGGQMNLIGGSLTFADPGTWTNLGVIDTAAGTTLAVNGTLTFEPSASMTGTGNLTVSGSGALRLLIAGTVPGTDYPQINLGGHATLNGALIVTVMGGFEPTVCDEFVIMTYGSRTGSFSSVATGGLPNCVELNPVFDDGAGTLTLVTSIDCDCNGTPDSLEEGACCIDGMACTERTPAVCLAAGGTPLGNCTSCPTQNASINVEPGGEIFVHVIGPPVECAAAAAAEPCPAEPPACPPGEPLMDPWVSPADPSMCHNFGVTDSPPIPAGFFDPGSDPFTGSVCLEGEPLGLRAFGAADTIIERSADPFGPCDLPSVAAIDVAIGVAALSLRSVDPMTVTYGGVNPEDWDVAVDLSPTVTPPAGILRATKTHCNGGSYTSTLHVQPRFTFTKVADPGQVRVLDTGAAGIPHVTLEQTDPIGWVAEVDPALGVQGDACSDFHAGVDEVAPRTSCDLDNDGTANACDNCPDDANIDQADADADDVGDLCDNCPYRANPDQADGNANNIGDACEPPFCTAPQDCNSNGTPDDCDVDSGAIPDCNANAIPDDCEADCNANNRPDDCDIALGEGTGNRASEPPTPSGGPAPLVGLAPDLASGVLTNAPHSALAQGQSSISLSPANSTGPVGSFHSLSALVTDGGAPVVGALVTFEALSGPNAGVLGTDETDANGQATLSYVGAQGEGTDQIVASHNDGQTVHSSNIVSRSWLGSLDCNFNGVPDECEEAGAPAATLLGGVSRRLHGGSGDCDLALNVAGRVQNDNVSSEPRSGGISELRLRFDIPPGGPGTTPVAIHQQVCPGGTQGHYQLYTGPSSVAASIEGAELVLVFTPALANAHTYRITVGPEVTGVPCQSIEVRGLVSDATGDGLVNAADRSAIVGVWTGSGFSCRTDITGNGQTNAGDRSAVVGAWTNPAANCAP